MVIWLLWHVNNNFEVCELWSIIVGFHVKLVIGRICFYSIGSHSMVYWSIIPASTFCLLPLSHGLCITERWHCVNTSLWNCRQFPIWQEKKRKGLWMMSDWRTGPILPLIYPHHITQRRWIQKWVFCIVLCVFRVFEQLEYFF